MGKIKMAVVADVHLDIAKDGEKRIDAFLKAAREENVDFIIHLGDFAYPNDTSKTKCPIDKMPSNVRNAYERPSKIDKEAILKKYSSFEKPAYHTMGNHDFDFLSPDDAIRMYGIPNGYYSFHMNGWHFIVLDGNYFKDENGNYVHYDCANYFYRNLPYLNPEQLNWLENELKDGDEPVVMFSHQALFHYDGCIKNLPDFEKIIKEAKSRGREIRMCLSGHMHLDDLDLIDGTYYHNVASLFGDTQHFLHDISCQGWLFRRRNATVVVRRSVGCTDRYSHRQTHHGAHKRRSPEKDNICHASHQRNCRHDVKS